MSSEDVSGEPRSWWQDRSVWWALLLATWLRILPLAMWPMQTCVRDECTYIKLANRILEGQGLTSAAAGWLWAPGYPYLMALHKDLLGFAGTTRVTQTLLFLVALPVAWTLVRRTLDLGAARWTVWLLALSPTLVFFSTTLWSESLYTSILWIAIAALGWARKGSVPRALLPGVLIGVCVLFRGVATYMLPIFALGLIWQRWRSRGAWIGAAALVVSATLTVAPWSIHASQKFGGLVVSDRTMGQMMWLGNNTFEPITFDWGNGTITGSAFDEAKRVGRSRCDKDMGPVAWDDCERAGGVTWIEENPEEFVRRIPLRLAQLFNPHSFLTRHLNWGKWPEVGAPFRSALIGLTVVWSGITVLGGIVGAWSRGRGWLLIVTAGLVLYHMAAISALAGLSRYRVPLDAIWMVWAACFLAAPRASLRALGASRWRTIGCVLTLAFVVPLMLWFLPAGFSS